MASQKKDEDVPAQDESKKEDSVKQENETKGATGAEGEKSEDMQYFEAQAESVRKFLAQSLGIKDEPKLESRLDEVSFEGIARFIASGKCKKIVTMAGAGISTSAGIPDFRSPGTGLYDNLQKYDLPSPQSVFDISYFDENPEPFFMLAKELFPGTLKPTMCHYFLKLLDVKGKLAQHFTQNIDTLERVSGLKDDKLVEAHGTFNTGHCRVCSHQYTQDWMKEKIFSGDSVVPKCEQKDCKGVVKPDIVFFGENLPAKFVLSLQHLEDCDMLIIFGTSLVVQPFASLTSRVKDDVPRLYINMEKSTTEGDWTAMLFGGSSFNFDGEDNIRDVFWQGTCDDGCAALADLLGWGEELRKMVQKEHAEIDKTSTGSSGAASKKASLPGKSTKKDNKKSST